MQPAIQQSARRVTPPPHSVHLAPTRKNSLLPPENACPHALPARFPTTSSDDAYLVPPTVPPARPMANASLARPSRPYSRAEGAPVYVPSQLTGKIRSQAAHRAPAIALPVPVVGTISASLAPMVQS